MQPTVPAGDWGQGTNSGYFHRNCERPEVFLPAQEVGLSKPLKILPETGRTEA